MIGPHLGWFTGLVLYVLIWWTALFAVLPLWVETEDKPDPATGWRGAPRRPMMGRKLLVTTAVAAVLWAACAAVINSPWLSFRHGWLAMPPN